MPNCLKNPLIAQKYKPELGAALPGRRELPHLIRQVYVGRARVVCAAEREKLAAGPRQGGCAWRSHWFTQAAKSSHTKAVCLRKDALQGLRLIDLCH